VRSGWSLYYRRCDLNMRRGPEQRGFYKGQVAHLDDCLMLGGYLGLFEQGGRESSRRRVGRSPKVEGTFLASVAPVPSCLVDALNKCLRPATVRPALPL